MLPWGLEVWAGVNEQLSCKSAKSLNDQYKKSNVQKQEGMSCLDFHHRVPSHSAISFNNSIAYQNVSNVLQLSHKQGRENIIISRHTHTVLYAADGQ